jgi:DNA repair exonuclease SbcCD nuclease subunit
MKVFSDLHLDNNNKYFRRRNDGKSDLLAAQEQFLTDLFDSAAYGELIVCAGDLTDDNLLDSYVFGAVMHFAKLVRRHGERGGRVVLLEGNHCITDSKNVFSVVGGLSRMGLEALVCVNHPQTLMLEDCGKMVAIRAVPYMDDHKAMLDAMAEPIPGYEIPKLLFFHAAVRNALLDNGFPNDRGIELTAREVSQYDTIIGGDFHRHQCFDVAGKQVYYCGAPFTLKGGQEYKKGYMSVVDKTCEFHECVLDYPIITRRYDELSQLELPDDSSRITLKVRDVPNHELKTDLIDQLIALELYSYHIAMMPSQVVETEESLIAYSPTLSPEQNALLAIDKHVEACDPDDPLKKHEGMVKTIIGKTK